jgi:quercetin dioxygenase-like cupin family protein
VYVGLDDDGNEIFHKVAAGDCLHFSRGTAHAVHAITDMRIVALLTKRWDDCDTPIRAVEALEH